MGTNTRIDIVEQMIDRLSDCLTAESAKRLLRLRLDPRLQKEVQRLAEKSTEGTLTPDERTEYGDVIMLDTMITILKAKARQKLAVEGE